MKQILWTLSLGLATSFIACSESATSVENNNEHESLESFTDSRDNREYKKVTIGEQTWMAENPYFEKYFYTWEEAKKACPEGWSPGIFRFPSCSCLRQLRHRQEKSHDRRCILWQNG